MPFAILSPMHAEYNNRTVKPGFEAHSLSCRLGNTMTAFIHPAAAVLFAARRSRQCGHQLRQTRGSSTSIVHATPSCSIDKALRALRKAKDLRDEERSRRDTLSQHENIHPSCDAKYSVALNSRLDTKVDKTGVVYLVGTGPGDPGLLTLRAVQLMRQADVVLYDRLVSPQILDYVSDSATMVYVGKEKGFHTRSQEEIHELMREFAFSKPGLTVLRLKGGDPFVFGRGGEETEYLEKHGIKVRVVPGITAAAGIGAELGIPLTHRGAAHSVKFLTGHMRDGVDLDIGEVSQETTLVVYMGLSALTSLMHDVLDRGLAPSTPAVAVERGTTPDQRVVWSTADKLAEDVADTALQSPTLIIIGDVVALAPGYRLGMADDIQNTQSAARTAKKDRKVLTGHSDVPSSKVALGA